MAGYMVLGDSDSVALVGDALKPTITVSAADFNNVIEKEFLNTHIENRTKELTFYHDPNSNITVITSPIHAHQYAEMLSHLNTYFAATGVNTPRQFLMGLKGHGATEGHIVTAYSNEDRSVVKVFDPKVSDATKFFAKDPINSLTSLAASLLRSIKPNPKQTVSLIDNSNEEPSTISVEYLSLGTQSFFDPASCGYHCAATMKICLGLLRKNNELTREAILKRTGNPVSEGYAVMTEVNADKVDLGFFSFIKKAWLDTLMPLENKEQHKKANFVHYFLGWPSDSSTAKKVFYFLTLGFITNPLINSIRRPIEFLFNAASETANYFKNRLIDWAPTKPGAQYLRSALMLLTYGLQGLFKGAYFALRTVTSPITSFQAAQRIENRVLRTLLSIGSVLTSIAAFAALAYFVAPLALAGLVGAAGTVLSALAYPTSQLFLLMGLSLAPASAALFTLITSISLFEAFKGIGTSLLSKFIVKKPLQEENSNSWNNFEGFDLLNIPDAAPTIPGISPSLNGLMLPNNSAEEGRSEVEHHPSPFNRERNNTEVKNDLIEVDKLGFN